MFYFVQIPESVENLRSTIRSKRFVCCQKGLPVRLLLTDFWDTSNLGSFQKEVSPAALTQGINRQSLDES
jgi:hypothetical protein